MIQAGLTISPFDLSPGQVAALIGLSRGRNKAEREEMEEARRKSER